MNPSEIIPSTGENPSPPTSPRLHSHFENLISTRPNNNNKDSPAKNKIHGQSTHPTTFLTIDPSQFRSMVRTLTGIQQDSLNKHVRDMVICISSLESGKHLLNVSQEKCLDCLLYCSLFSQGGYEIESDTLIQLWMAAGLVTEEPMEEIGAAYLDALKFRKIISVSREEHSTGKIWFKVNDCRILEQAVVGISKIRLVRVDFTHPNSNSNSNSNCDFLPIEPCHVAFKGLPNNLEMVHRSSQIRAFLMLRGHESFIDCLPYDFFLSLNLLQALDLSGTKLKELPNSIGNVGCLRYLDLSETRIKRLPETIENLGNLQTLKLHNCPNLIALPKATKWLTSLRHLDLGGRSLGCRLQSMPPGMGALTSLRTLSEFVVGRRENGCGIGELKNMFNLRGKLRLSKLENVASAIEAEEAKLRDKRRITKLELRWSSNTNGGTKPETFVADQGVIEQLRPPPYLEELRILCYRGLMFPTWISDPSLVNLVSITLFKCEKCPLLPSLGQLCSLESLRLIEFNSLRIIDFHFHRDTANPARNQDVAFPKLKRLAIKSMVKLITWKEIEPKDFPCLIELSIEGCPRLNDICSLSNMNSLEYLEINHCMQLESLLEGDLPDSVKTLVIDACPSLRLSSSMEDTQNWQKTEHSPYLLIYQREQEGI